MIEIKADPTNYRVLLIKFDQALQFSERAIRQGFFRLGRDLKASADREILRRPKGGRVYLIRGPGGRRRRHIASAPGETHANFSGRLRRSIGWEVRGAQELEFGYGAGPEAGAVPRYGIFLEFGTRRMEPRPSLRNAIGDIERNAEAHFDQALAREFA
jgi:HK97 gp10 family phage protein